MIQGMQAPKTDYPNKSQKYIMALFPVYGYMILNPFSAVNRKDAQNHRKRFIKTDDGNRIGEIMTLSL